MIIKREINGELIEIKLTPAELCLASEKYNLLNRAMDVRNKMRDLAESGEIPLSPKQFENAPEEALKEFTLYAASVVEKRLDNNDGYWESFWLTVEYALTDCIDWDEQLPKLIASNTEVESHEQ